MRNLNKINIQFKITKQQLNLTEPFYENSALTLNSDIHEEISERKRWCCSHITVYTLSFSLLLVNRPCPQS